MKNNKTPALAIAILMSLCSLNSVAEPQLDHALSDTQALGLYSTTQFQLNQGDCKDCAITPQALWYFKQEMIAIPCRNAPSLDPHLSAQDDVKQWHRNSSSKHSMPPLVWLGSPHITTGKFSQDGKWLENANHKTPLSITPKIESNLSYYNASSAQHFAGRNLVVRGIGQESQLTARSLWPLDYNLNLQQIPYQPLAPKETIADLIRDHNGGAHKAFAARVLYKKSALTNLQNKPVLSFELNGAQGDDDEAHGGHFAVATGRFGANGEWHDWLVNNFYNLSSVSEKGIIAASLPMDSYQGDLNSGQSWYRPSYMLVAVLKDERSAATYQSAIN